VTDHGRDTEPDHPHRRHADAEMIRAHARLDALERMLLGGHSAEDHGLRGAVHELALLVRDLREDITRELAKLESMWPRARADFDRAVVAHNASAMAAMRQPWWERFALVAMLFFVTMLAGRAMRWW
jgi:predicted RNA-binding Zn ribbon-like protein